MSYHAKKPAPRPTPCPPEDIARTDGTRIFRLINPELYAVRLLDPTQEMPKSQLTSDYAGTHVPRHAFLMGTIPGSSS